MTRVKLAYLDNTGKVASGLLPSGGAIDGVAQGKGVFIAEPFTFTPGTEEWTQVPGFGPWELDGNLMAEIRNITVAAKVNSTEADSVSIRVYAESSLGPFTLQESFPAATDAEEKAIVSPADPPAYPLVSAEGVIVRVEARWASGNPPADAEATVTIDYALALTVAYDITPD
jgi:hypothetical protein